MHLAKAYEQMAELIKNDKRRALEIETYYGKNY
jgi:hypothetical protein